MLIPGIELLEEIGRGSRSVVYRARKDERMLAVKLLSDPDALAATSFRKEAALQGRLRHRGLRDILEVGEVEGRPYLVMQFVDGQTLDEMLDLGPLSEAQVLAIARDLGGALGEVHRHGLVHRDVKPQNILVDRSGAARLLDFGFATRSQPELAGEVVGTFAYSAPEQTRMLSRPVDARADLYSLGIVLYECLAGHPPFQSSDVGTLLHLHAAQPPAPLTEGSPALAGLIARLLAKDPDDRYQTAQGLLADLARLPTLNARFRVDGQLRLGGEESSGPLYSVGLVGRRDELAWLAERWQRTREGTGCVVMVEGEAGVGKSRLAEEFFKGVVHSRAVVVRARCRPDMAPLGAMRALMEDRLQRISELSSQQRSRALEQFLGAVGDLSGLLRGFTPALDRILPEGAANPGLEEAQDQFYQALADLFLRSAEFGPTLILVEDVHWLDPASLLAMQLRAHKLRSTAVMLVATTRSQGAERFVERMEVRAEDRLSLAPLESEEVETLVRAHLGGRVEADVLQAIVLASHGNPFATGEYVHALLDGGLLVPHWGSWRLTGGLQSLILPGDVLALVLQRMEQVRAQVLEVLVVAAVIGPRFELDLVRQCLGAQDELYSMVAEGVRFHLIEPLEKGEYGFVHDSVREALLQGSDESRLQELHEQVARALEARGIREGDVFRLARHYSRTCPERNREKIYRTSLAAGLAAARKFADAEAYEFLQQAVGSGPAARGLLEELADVCTRTGRLSEALALYARLLERLQAGPPRARVYGKAAWCHVANQDLTRAWEDVNRALAEVDRPLPTTPGACLAAMFAPLRPQVQPRLLLRLHEIALTIGYLKGELWPVLAADARAVRLARKSPPCREVARVWGAHSMLLAALGLGRWFPRYARRAEDYCRQANDPIGQAFCSIYRIHATHFVGDDQEAERLAQLHLRTERTWLGTWEFQNGCFDLAYNLVLRGFVERAAVWAEEGRRQGSGLSHTVLSVYGGILAMQGRVGESRELMREAERGLPGPVHLHREGPYLAFRLLCELESGEVGSAFDQVIETYRALGLPLRRTPFFLKAFHVFAARGYLESARTHELKRSLADLAAVASTPTLQAHLRVLQGGWERLQGRPAQALARLRQAEELSWRGDVPAVRLEVCRQRAHLLQAQGLEPAARREAQLALNLAAELGWRSRVRLLQREFKLGSVAPTRSHSAQSSPAGGGARLRRHLEAFLQVSRASAEVLDLQELARITLHEVIRILGAERGFLFLLEDASLRLMAGRDAQGSDLGQAQDYSRTLVEQVAQSGQPVVVSSTPESATQSVVAYDLRSIMAAPLKARERILGVIYLDNRLARGVFGEEDLQILGALAAHIAFGIETSRATRLQVEVASERRQRLLAESLGELTAALISTVGVPQVLERLLDSLARVLHFDSACAVMLDGDQLRTVVARGLEAPASVPAADDPLWSKVVSSRQAFVSSGKMALPLVTPHSLVGVVVLAAEQFEPAALELATTFVGHAGIVVENVRLFNEVQHMATVDGLTGAFNRRFFFQQAEVALAAARRLGHALSVLMFDVDHFKKFNDTHGHAVGDEVLRTVAARCQAALRSIDLFGRYGGEEFAVLLPGLGNPAEVREVAERLRCAVGGQPFSTAAGQLSVTISLGLACLEREASLDQLLERADECLYAAKQAGRNRVEG